MKLQTYLTEAKWKVGDWIKQERRDATVYAFVLEILKNGSAKVLHIDTSRPVPVIASTRFWNPPPEPMKAVEVPEGLFKKLEKKLKKTKYSNMKLR